MYLAKVIGTVVSTSKDERLIGFKLLLARRIDEQGEQTGSREIGGDTVGAGTGEAVIAAAGTSARNAVDRPNSPVDAAIVGIVDTVEIDQVS